MADVGRPTLYVPERIARAITAYLDECKAQFYLPTVEGLAVHLSMARSTIYLWAKEHPEFSDILERILALQASMLIQNGLKGEYNAPLTKMMLTKHGYKDESDITSGGQPIAQLTMETERLLASFETFSGNEQLSDALEAVERLTSQARRELFKDPAYFPLFFAYYFTEYIKYPFADFHFRMFADTGRLLNGAIRELAWIMFRESAKTSIAKALIVYSHLHRAASVPRRRQLR